MADNDLYVSGCQGCGIQFGIPKAAKEAWEKSYKRFYCPNGCVLSWDPPSEEDKEINKLRREVQSLKDKLANSETKVETLEAKVAELSSELEIWRPTSEAVHS